MVNNSMLAGLSLIGIGVSTAQRTVMKTQRAASGGHGVVFAFD